MIRKLLLATVAPLLVASACAHEAADDAVRVVAARPIDALRAAPAHAADAGTVRFEVEVTAGPDGGPSMVATGATDHTTGHGSLTLDAGGLLGALPGVDGTIDVVLADGVAYLRVPYLAAVTGTDGWLSAPFDSLGDGAASLGLGLASTDPSPLLETLRGVADEVVDEGRESVRGVSTTRYAASIDLDRALADAPPSARERLDALLAELGADLPTVPVTVWVDDEGLPRRLEMALAGAGDGSGASVQIELFDYGQPVTIAVPPAADVTPIGELLTPLTSLFGEAGS